MTDGAGAVVERYRYDAYGKRTVTDPAGATRAGTAISMERGFQGRPIDHETGLYYFRTRYYNPSLGRFLNRMPWWRMQTGWMSNYHVMDSASFALFEEMGRTAHASYPQGRYNLYDAWLNAPSNYVEPYSNPAAGYAAGTAAGIVIAPVVADVLIGIGIGIGIWAAAETLPLMPCVYRCPCSPDRRWTIFVPVVEGCPLAMGPYTCPGNSCKPGMVVTCRLGW